MAPRFFPPELLPDSPSTRGGLVLLVGLVAVCGGVEAVLALSDIGIGPQRLRTIAFDYAGFWPGLLGSWAPNYALQPWAMFLTYGFLHGGIVHLGINMVTLWSLGVVVMDRVGTRGFALLYGTSILGGGLGYGLLAPGLTPMVGASGALFGLTGGILAWAYVDRFTWAQGMWPVIRAALMLLALNLILWWAMGGHLAWQTHLGGFVTGWIVALLIDPRARPAD